QDVFRPLLAFKIWGVTYAADQKFYRWIAMADALAVYCLCMMVAERSWIKIIFALILAFRPQTFLEDRALLAIISVALMCRGFASQKKPFFIAAGVFAIGSCLYSLDIGVTLLGGFGFYFLFNPKKFLRPFLIGAASASLLFGIYLLFIGGLKNF